LNALFAERLSWLYYQFTKTGGLARPGTETEYLERGRPEVPQTETDPSRAEAVNTLVGIRPGETIEVVRFLSLPIEPKRIEELGARFLGGWFNGLFVPRAVVIDRVLRAVRPSIELEVVGISKAPPLGGQPQAWMTLATAKQISGEAPGAPMTLDRIEIELVSGTDAEAFAERHVADLPDGLLLQTTEKVTSSLDQNLASNQLGFILASMLAFLSAAFIIMTGLTTGLAEQERGLAVLRCIGAEKLQLALTQLYTGLIVGGIGAVIGTPLGVGLAWGIISLNQDRLPTGLHVPLDMLAIAFSGSLVAGLLGAAFPAWRAARTSPLKALANRAESTKPKHILRVLWFALAGIIIQAIVVGGSPNKDVLFWSYATLGLPAMFVGYFLISVPVIVAVSKVCAGPLSRLLRLPPRLLQGTIDATPFRHGFTAGAMMAGLALMIAIWANGGAVMRDWLGKIEFPDAFVNGLRLPAEAQTRLEQLAYVSDTCAITMHPVEVDAFGVSVLQQYSTTFIAFEPTEFFEMTNLQFLDGDPAVALERLEAGNAIIVGREFNVAQGLGVGDTFTCRDRGVEHTFDIVGVVTSPGLELASKFFNIGEEYVDQSIHAVFGSRGDMRTLFGSDNIQLIQIAFDRDGLASSAPDGVVTDAARSEWAVDQIERELFGFGVIDAGSGVRIKDQIQMFIGGSLFVFSAVAVVSMLVACFGVANLIAASIESRRFEFGVLRAVGAQRGLLTRLVVGEAIIIGITAAIAGTLMGIQGAWAGMRIYEMLLGIGMTLRPPPGPIIIGWVIVLLFTVGAAAPSIIKLTQRNTRELLAAAKG
ncbi:MAG: FtsX-like permease family protein, partial [Planctomycetota bacterium]